MRPYCSTKPTLALALGTALLAGQFHSHAMLSGPYAPDQFTLHLWHMDAPAAPVPDAGSVALPLNAVANGATLGTASYTGFGTALNTIDGGQAGGNTATAIDAYAGPVALANGAGDNTAWSFADPTTRAFTYEAVVWVGFDPAQSFAAVASGGTGRAQSMQIISGEQDSSGGGTRAFQFRVIPVGVALTGSDANTVRLEFINVNNGTSIQSLWAPLPTTAPHAIASNGWYHVAVTYNGQPGTPNNFKLYWTAMDPSLTSANEILSTTMNLNLPNGAVDFCIGNQGRTTPNNNWIGLIDEVRVSSLARSAGGMMFASPQVVIETQPKSQIVLPGDNVSLISSASGGGILHYQWQFFSTNLPSATNATLVISNITPELAGPYRVVVNNGLTTENSQEATISLGIPVTELFATGVRDDGSRQPGGWIDPHYTLVQSDDPLFPGPTVYVSSAPPAAWLANSETSQWISPLDGGNFAGGNFTYRTTFLLDSGDPAKVQINGLLIGDNQLVDVKVNGASTGLTNAGVLGLFSPVELTSGFVAGPNTIDFVISNAPGTGPNPSAFRAELRGATMPLVSAAPQLLSGPSNISTQAQQTATFAVTVTGSPTLTYQWYHGSNPLPGQTGRKLVLPNLTTGQSGTYTVYVTNSAGWTSASAALTVTTPPAFAWAGTTSADWDTFTANWTGAGTIYSQFSDVLFDVRGVGQAYLNLAQTITPNSITVDAANDYTFGSFAANGVLAGSFPLVKKNSGKLILSVTNLSTGPVTVEAGVLQVGFFDSAASLGLGPVSVSNNAALVFARTGGWTVPNEISGAGAITNSSGSAVLIASNSYTGPTVIQGFSTVSARNSSALGSPSAGTFVEDFGQLLVDAPVHLVGEPLSLNGTGPAGDGALRKGGSSVSAIGSPITLAGNAMIKVDGGSTLQLTNPAGLNATGKALTLAADASGVGMAYSPLLMGSGLLTKNGAGTWQLLSTANTGTGGTFIEAGVLQVGNGLLNGSLLSGTITNNGTLTFNGATDQTINNPITGTGGITHSGSNTTTLVAANTYDGVTAVNNGTLLVAHDNALGNPLTNTTTSGNFGAVSRVGFSNNVTVAEGFVMAGRQPTDISGISAHLINLSGTNTLTGPLSIVAGGNQYNIESAGGLLVVAGDFSSAGLSGRFLNLQGAGQAIWTGAINDGGLNLSVTNRGPGTWRLAGSNSYAGPTYIAAGKLLINGSIGTNAVWVHASGTLGGVGLINGAVTVQGSGMLSPGDNGIGKLTISNRLVMQAGSTNIFDVNAGTGASDEVADLTSVTFGGTLAINNLGGAITTASTFKLFSAEAYSGAFEKILPAAPGGGLAWNTNTLPVDGILRVGTGVAQDPTNITYTVSNGSLNLSWPASHLGWIVQSNSVGVAAGAQWYPVPGSSGVTSLSIPINTSATEVYYRLIKP